MQYTPLPARARVVIARPLILSLRQVMRLTGLTRGELYYLLVLGDFPEPVASGVWQEDAVWLWIVELVSRAAVKD
jgi:predicted DNA-binding transcriptional regulator AlpA